MVTLLINLPQLPLHRTLCVLCQARRQPRGHPYLLADGDLCLVGLGPLGWAVNLAVGHEGALGQGVTGCHLFRHGVHSYNRRRQGEKKSTVRMRMYAGVIYIHSLCVVRTSVYSRDGDELFRIHLLEHNITNKQTGFKLSSLVPLGSYILYEEHQD